METADQPILELQDISKNFGGTKALKNVDFTLNKGEVHALIGENGAGKSTLSRIIAGDILKDGGRIFLQGNEVQIRKPQDARDLGIGMVYQELRLIPYISVAENIFLNQYPKNSATFINWKELNRRSEEVMHKWRIKLEKDAILQNLPIAKQQLVEILKSLSLNPRILIMDEPTSSLGFTDVQSLFELIAYLKGRGVSIIYISHILDEVFKISDRITVLRDGNICGTYSPEDVKPEEVINVMLNRKGERPSEQSFNRIHSSESLLELRNISSGDMVKNISFKLKRGEILGITGLVGSGKTELAQCIFGLRKIDSGFILLEDREVKIYTPKDAIAHRIGLIPEDRRKEGIFKILSIRDNVSFLVLKTLKKLGLINKKKQKVIVDEYVNKLAIKCSSLEQNLNELSGGNQQKVVISRWLTINPKLLIADEPTRGIDVGTKKEIYYLLKKIANKGTGIIVLSEEIDEILELADRIIVLSRGNVTKVYDDNNISKGELTLCTTGCLD